jgi:hypothetical protein
VYIAYRSRSKGARHQLGSKTRRPNIHDNDDVTPSVPTPTTALTPNSHGSNAPPGAIDHILSERDYWRNVALNGQPRQQLPQFYHPQSQSVPPQHMHYQHFPATNFALSGGDAQHQGHTEHVGLARAFEPLVQGGAPPEFSALHQMSPGGFPPAPSGYNTASSTARDHDRSGWTTVQPQPSGYHHEGHT